MFNKVSKNYTGCQK